MQDALSEPSAHGRDDFVCARSKESCGESVEKKRRETFKAENLSRPSLGAFDFEQGPAATLGFLANSSVFGQAVVDAPGLCGNKALFYSVFQAGDSVDVFANIRIREDDGDASNFAWEGGVEFGRAFKRHVHAFEDNGLVVFKRRAGNFSNDRPEARFDARIVFRREVRKERGLRSKKSHFEEVEREDSGTASAGEGSC